MSLTAAERRRAVADIMPGPIVRPTTDLGNAERFAEQHGADVRYCFPTSTWYEFDGSRWVPDAMGAVMRRAKETARRIANEAAAAHDDEFKQLIAWANQSQSRSRLDAMVELAKSEQPIPISRDAFDADGWILNFTNCTVDLATGEARPHNRADFISKTTGVEYSTSPGDDPELWLEFLASIFDADVELIAYVQRYFGAALVGVVREHVLAILHGKGANGKSTFIDTIMAAMGDYGLAAAPGLFMAKRNEGHPTELADLCGVRLVVLQETRDGQRLDEGLVKALTGGDKIRARKMREDFWQFTPTHTAALVTNHKPIVRGTDLGVWRRLRLIPFCVTVPLAEQDKSLGEKLKAELPAIARWLVTGCLAWQREGLNEPPKVLAATEGYKVESDTFGRWFEERLKLEPLEEIRASDAFKNYQAWCEGNGERNCSNRTFGERMLEKIVGKRVSNGTWYQGVTWKRDSDLE